MAGEANTTVYEVGVVTERERLLREALGMLGQTLADVQLGLDLEEIGEVERTRLLKTLGHVASFADSISLTLGGGVERAIPSEAVVSPLLLQPEVHTNGNGHVGSNGHSNGNGSRNGADHTHDTVSTNGHKDVVDEPEDATDKTDEAPVVDQVQGSEPSQPSEAEPINAELTETLSAVEQPVVDHEPVTEVITKPSAKAFGMDPERYDTLKNFMLAHVGEPMRVADILAVLPDSMTTGAKRQAFKKFKTILARDPKFAGRLVDQDKTSNRKYTLLPESGTSETAQQVESIQVKTGQTEAPTEAETQVEAKTEAPNEPEAVCLGETQWGAKILQSEGGEPYLEFNGQKINMRPETTMLFVRLLKGGSKLYDDLLAELLSEDPEMTKPKLTGMIRELQNFFTEYADEKLFKYQMINTREEGRKRLVAIQKAGPDFLARAQ